MERLDFASRTGLLGQLALPTPFSFTQPVPSATWLQNLQGQPARPTYTHNPCISLPATSLNIKEAFVELLRNSK
jgi:hypothetical protein